MQSFMVPPPVPTIAVLNRDETLYKPAPGADPFQGVLIAMGILSVEEAAEQGILLSVTLPAGTTGEVVEMCAGSCPHYLETGKPCSYVVRLSDGPIAGEEIVLTGDIVDTYPLGSVWTESDDAALSALLEETTAAYNERADLLAEDAAQDSQWPDEEWPTDSYEEPWPFGYGPWDEEGD